MEMIEVKTSELIGPALDWAVAKAVGTKIDDSHGKELRIDVGAGFQSPWIPSVNWHQGGPLIENHAITIAPYYMNMGGMPHYWVAEPWGDCPLPVDGKTALIASCRAIVASKLGDTVMVPKELVQGA